MGIVLADYPLMYSLTMVQIYIIADVPLMRFSGIRISSYFITVNSSMAYILIPEILAYTVPKTPNFSSRLSPNCFKL